MDLGSGFSREENEEKPLPAGWYKAVILKEVTKQTKNGKGKLTTLTVQVVDGEHKGSVQNDRFCLVHSNPVAERIGRARLASILSAVGKELIKEPSELFNIPLYIECVHKDSDEYGTQSEIKSYKSVAKYNELHQNDEGGDSDLDDVF